MTKDKPRCNEANKLKMIAMIETIMKMLIGFRILTWIRSSIPAIPLKIKKYGLDKSLDEKEVFVPPLKQLKETKVRRYYYYY
jgi:hypothetical protein